MKFAAFTFLLLVLGFILGVTCPFLKDVNVNWVFIGIPISYFAAIYGCNIALGDK